jgi:tRNA(Ile2) C34 agmatinyltransferase TiaS
MGGQDVLGYVEFLKQMEAGTVMENKAGQVVIKTESAKTLAKPMIPPEAPKCPKCGAQLIQTIAGGQKRCGACGEQWNPDGARLQPTPPQSRADLFK